MCVTITLIVVAYGREWRVFSPLAHVPQSQLQHASQSKRHREGHRYTSSNMHHITQNCLHTYVQYICSNSYITANRQSRTGGHYAADRYTESCAQAFRRCVSAAFDSAQQRPDTLWTEPNNNTTTTNANTPTFLWNAKRKTVNVNDERTNERTRDITPHIGGDGCCCCWILLIRLVRACVRNEPPTHPIERFEQNRRTNQELFRSFWRPFKVVFLIKCANAFSYQLRRRRQWSPRPPLPHGQ